MIQKQEVYTKNIMITPTIAKEMLSKSEGNRPLHKPTIEGYVRDLQNGKWYIGETIKFDINGILIDGHHRLEAIVWSGIEALTIVIYNLPVESRNGINLARAWKPWDISRIAGESFGRRHFSIAQILELGISYVGSGRISLTYQEKKDLVRKYESALNFVVKSGGHDRYVNNTVLAVVARAFYHTSDCERLDEFIGVVKSGLYDEDQGDLSAVLLRNWMIDSDKRGSTPKRGEVYWRTESALHHFLKRKNVHKVYPASKELFSLKLDSDLKVVPA